jgi:hypothetical protein
MGMIEMYVTVDLDEPTHDKIAKAWARVSCFGPVVGRISKSGNGVHIKSKRTVPQDVPPTPLVRWWCLDDEKRIAEDMKNTVDANQVLWDETDGRKAGEWMDSLSELLAEYMIEQSLDEMWSGGRL